MLVWGLASLEAASRPFFTAAAEVVLAAPSLAHYNSYTLSNLTWSFGKVRSPAGASSGRSSITGNACHGQHHQQQASHAPVSLANANWKIECPFDP